MSKVVHKGWMVRYGWRKIGRSFIHMQYFILESRLLAYYKKKPQDYVEEVDNLISSTLAEREQDIIRLYYGLDKECHTSEDMSRQFGLSRERVRQVGLVAMEKLKHAARKEGRRQYW